jgi:hypothetical protein
MRDLNNRKASVSIGPARCYIGRMRHEVSQFQLVPNMSVSPSENSRSELEEAEMIHGTKCAKLFLVIVIYRSCNV